MILDYSIGHVVGVNMAGGRYESLYQERIDTPSSLLSLEPAYGNCNVVSARCTCTTLEQNLRVNSWILSSQQLDPCT